MSFDQSLKCVVRVALFQIAKGERALSFTMGDFPIKVTQDSPFAIVAPYLFFG
jgi:hypothetical protein